MLRKVYILLSLESEKPKSPEVVNAEVSQGAISWISNLFKGDMDSIDISWSVGVALTFASLFYYTGYQVGTAQPHTIRVGVAVITMMMMIIMMMMIAVLEQSM